MSFKVTSLTLWHGLSFTHTHTEDDDDNDDDDELQLKQGGETEITFFFGKEQRGTIAGWDREKYYSDQIITILKDYLLSSHHKNSRRQATENGLRAGIV